MMMMRNFLKSKTTVSDVDVAVQVGVAVLVGVPLRVLFRVAFPVLVPDLGSPCPLRFVLGFPGCWLVSFAAAAVYELCSQFEDDRGYVAGGEVSQPREIVATIAR